MSQPVLFVLPSVQTAGAEIQAMLQIRELARRGVPVRLMVLSATVDPSVLAEAGQAAENVCILRNPASVLGPAFLKAMWRDLPRAAAFARRHGIGTVIAHLPPAHFFARILSLALALRGRSVRLIQYHHSEEPRDAGLPSVGKSLFFALDQSLARLCDHAHWHVSAAVLNHVSAERFTKRSAVIHNFCDMDSAGDVCAARRLVAGLDTGPETFLILLPGRLVATKGHLLLLGAFRRMVDELRIGPEEIRLVFAGEGPHRTAIEAAIARHDLGGHVTMLGGLPHATLLALMPMADLVVVPSLIEGFGNVSVEAIARRVPVLASDAGGLKEIVQHGVTGLQFPAGDEEALHAALAEAWRRRNAPAIDLDAAASQIRARFGLARHIDRLQALLAH